MSATVSPIIPGFAPDPSIVLVDGTYFLVNSSFHIFPGLPLYASQDLRSWKHIGNALNRRSQMSLANSLTQIHPLPDSGDPVLATGGLYAPTIRHHDGKFYITCTNVAVNETQNFILSTPDIYAPDKWSDPVYFSFRGIDPSISFLPDGKAYIHGSAAPGPMTRIHMFEIDVETGEKRSEERMVWEGTGGTWPEGPHVYHRGDDFMYLIISEGGTFSGHKVTAARARDVWGPYEACPLNPVLTAAEGGYVQHVGHCDLFENTDGGWWYVCLGVRKDGRGRFVMGRETFLMKGGWEQNGWPCFEGEVVSGASLTVAERGVDWVYVRDAELERYTFWGDTVTIRGRDVDLDSPSASPSFVGKRQRVLNGCASAVLSPMDRKWPDVKAGLAVYKDEFRCARVYYEAADSAIVVEVVNRAKDVSRMDRLAVDDVERLGLKIEYEEHEYRFFKREQGDWELVGTVDTLDMTGLDFVGPIVGGFVTCSQGKEFEIQFEDLRID